MNQTGHVPNERRAANDPSEDPVLSALLRYTLPAAIVGIVGLLLFLAWGLSL